MQFSDLFRVGVYTGFLCVDVYANHLERKKTLL